MIAAGSPIQSLGAVALPKYRRMLSLLVVHGILLLTAYCVSFLLRYDLPFDRRQMMLLLATAPIVVLINLTTLQAVGQLGTWWQYTGLPDLRDLCFASLGSAAFLIASTWLFRPAGYSRAVLLIDAFLNICVIGGVKFGFRYLVEARRQVPVTRRAVIVGAGASGVALAHDLRQAADLGFQAIGFVDDDLQKLGQKIAGLRVLGSMDELKAIIDEHGISCVLIAISAIPGNKLEGALAACKTSRVEFKILPSIAVRMNQHLAKELRGVRLEDLLERSPVQTDLQAIRKALKNKVVLVTGAGGSIGSEIVRKLANLQVEKIVLFERSENDLFKLGLEMCTHFPHALCVPVVGDILDVAVLKSVFAEHRPSSVFHAAAYKHVPVMEDNCFQAVTNNIFGTYNVALLAQQYEADRFVMISSDKAVNPTNIMGVTKRVAELVVRSLIHTKTRYLSVRFGNVLGSNGSVVPIFQRQIMDGGPVTVTHPHVERYFMTIPEAVDLVLQASTMGVGGEVFFLDMGKPVSIDRIARNLIRLSGLEPDVDIQIKYTGLRPGEKMNEELKLSGEGIAATSHAQISVLYADPVDFHDVSDWIDELTASVARRNVAELVKILQSIVPEYQPSDRVLSACRVDRLDVAGGYAKARASLAQVRPAFTTRTAGVPLFAGTNSDSEPA